MIEALLGELASAGGTDIDFYMENKESSLEWYMMPRAKEYKYYGFSQALNKLKQIKILGESIQILHQEGVFHRDIKPEKVEGNIDFQKVDV